MTKVLTCKKCFSSFPQKMVIEGKTRTLNKRKYCLDCSPFKQHNTKQLHKADELERAGYRICTMCSEEKPKESFYKRNRATGTYHTWCRTCHAENAAARTAKFKQELVNYLGGSCGICGYFKYTGALEAHHLDPTQKDPEWKSFRLRKFSAKIKAELDKCVLLCSNCHREVHAGIVELPPT